MIDKRMKDDALIQKNLFAIKNEETDLIAKREIQEDLSNEKLEKESKKRPRQRQNSTNLVNDFKKASLENFKTDCIKEKSYSYKTW